MKKAMLYSISTLLMFGAASAASAADSTATATTSGSASIIRPVTITKSDDLAFAQIIRPATSSGTVTLSAASDTVAVTGGIVAMGTASRAKYTIDGEGGEIVSVTVPATFVISKGTDELTVTTAATGTTATLDGDGGEAGTADFAVGGSFTVASTTPTGAYTGTFDVSVAYQ